MIDRMYVLKGVLGIQRHGKWADIWPLRLIEPYHKKKAMAKRWCQYKRKVRVLDLEAPLESIE
jgi:hypothetical protein